MNLSEYQQKIATSSKPIVVDFWASWCVPCRVTKPILEKLAQEYSGQVEFLPIDADSAREVLAHLQVIGIPTVLTLRAGKVVGRVTGAQNEAGYRAMFEALVRGEEVRTPLSSFERLLRLGTGLLLLAVGFATTQWLVAGLGGLIAFWGVYDRCPIWRALTGLWQSRA